jgi:hypothetical protein
MRAACVVILLVSCRIGFDDHVDGGGSASMLVTKLTIDAPLLDSPNPSGQDCGTFEVFRAGDNTMMNDDLMAFAAVDSSSTMWFAYSCKDADLAWSETIGSWQPPSGTFQRYDGDPASPGIEELVSDAAIMSDGMAAYQLRQLRFAFGADGTVYGVGQRGRPDGVSQVVPVHMNQPIDLTALSYDLADDGVFLPPVAPWAAQTGTGREIMFDRGTFYLYSVHWDGITVTQTGVPLTSIAVATSTDMVSSSFAPEPMVTGWSDPYVSAWGGSYHMIARDLATNSYSYVHGTAPDDFDFAHAVPLGLAGFAGAPGAWDATNYIEHGASGDPRVSTARVVDGVLYVFYLAGIPPNAGAAEKGQDAKRGLGVFTIRLPE